MRDVEVPPPREPDLAARIGTSPDAFTFNPQLVDDALLVHHARLRHRSGRLVAPVDGQRKRDVYDSRNIAEGKVTLVHREAADGTEPADIGLARATGRDPTDGIVSAIDLGRWLNGLSANDREMLELRVAGHTLEETGERLGVSTSAVFARCRGLGRELAERMGVVLREDKKHSGTASSTGRIRKCTSAMSACAAA